MDLLINIFGAIFSIIGIALFQYWGWTLIAGYLIWQIWQNRRRTEYVSNVEHTLLQIVVPKNNDKKELSAEQLFASLHGILRPKSEIDAEGSIQEHLSFEIVSVKNVINFYVWVPKHLSDYVESQIYAQYPTVQILKDIEDYTTQDLDDRLSVISEVKTTKDFIFPLRTFQTFEVDPLAGITTVLSTLESNEQLWVQFLIRPVDDSWHAKSLQYIKETKDGKQTSWFQDWERRFMFLPFELAINFMRALVMPPEWSERAPKKEEKKELSPGQTTINAAIETKAEKIGYEVKIRVAYIGDSADVAKQRLQALYGGFKQYNTINLNGLAHGGYDTTVDALQDYRARYLDQTNMILNVEELASLYHLPHTSVETPSIAWTTTKVGEPPTNVPTLANTPQEELSLIGTTTFRQGNIKFGLKRKDRVRHLYIIGKSGVGKSFLLLLLTLSDIYHNQGFAIVDPHGDFARDAVKYIPEHRIKDVVYFNPHDLENPIAFNPMENDDPNMRGSITSEIIGVLKKMFGDSWGPRMEHILRFTLLALLETDKPNLLGITRMLTDKKYRNEVVSQITDVTVKSFWVNEFASWNDKFATEAVAPILNKVGAFTANPLVRNIIGQTKSSFDIRKIMDEGKILICDLSRGRLGEDNASTLGALLITKIQLAAMSRADISLNERRPFYLYVDEFQNFATESFAVILSEARKYGLYLTVANQYVAQMMPEVRDAVFGNVGSMVTFRVGADDAAALARYFEPSFEANDLQNLSIQNIYVTMSIDGDTSVPFSAKTLRLPEPTRDFTREISEYSRQQYNKPREAVEVEIAQWSGFGNDDKGASAETQSHLQGVSQAHTPSKDVPTRPSLEVANAQPRNYSELIKATHQKQSSGHAGANRNDERKGGNTGRNRKRNRGPRR